MTREELIVYVRLFIQAMENLEKGELFEKRKNELKAKFLNYENCFTTKQTAEVKKSEAVEEKDKTKELLIAQIDKTHNFILSLVSPNKAKYKEFIKSGSKSDLENSSMALLLEGSKYMLQGLKNNIELGINDEIIKPFEKAIDDFDKAHSISNSLKQDEGSATDKIKEIEADFRDYVKKTRFFVKSILSESEYNKFPKE